MTQRFFRNEYVSNAIQKHACFVPFLNFHVQHFIRATEPASRFN